MQQGKPTTCDPTCLPAIVYMATIVTVLEELEDVEVCGETQLIAIVRLTALSLREIASPGVGESVDSF
jgi:hypothetical protein